MRKTGLRNNRGSSVIESGAAISIFCAVAVPFLTFFVNLGAQLIMQAEVSHIANEAARVCDEDKYWLGLPRPGFNEERAAEKATEVAQHLCEQVGLKNASVKVSVKSLENFDVTQCEINVNAIGRIPFRTNVFGFDMAKLFPGNIYAKGLAAHAKVQPYAIIHMDAPTVEDQSVTRPLGHNRRDVAVIPVYGFFNNMAAGSPGTIPTPYGKGIAQMQPDNFFSLNHYHLKKTDIDTVIGDGAEAKLSGWHPKRKIDGRDLVFN